MEVGFEADTQSSAVSPKLSTFFLQGQGDSTTSGKTCRLIAGSGDRTRPERKLGTKWGLWGDAREFAASLQGGQTRLDCWKAPCRLTLLNSLEFEDTRGNQVRATGSTR